MLLTEVQSLSRHRSLQIAYDISEISIPYSAMSIPEHVHKPSCLDDPHHGKAHFSEASQCWPGHIVGLVALTPINTLLGKAENAT